MSCKPTFQKPQPGQSFSWEMLYHRCASDFGRAESAIACYEREISTLRSALNAANKALEQTKAERTKALQDASNLRVANATLQGKLDACASLTQSLKADTAQMGAAMVPFRVEWLPIVAALTAGSVGGFVLGRRSR